jgi:hypothetical protein
LLNKYFEGDQIKKKGMEWACSIMGGEKMCTGLGGEKSKVENTLEDVSLEGKIILKRILNK